MAYNNTPFDITAGSVQVLKEGFDLVNQNFAELNGTNKAALRDVQTSPTDTTAGRLMTNFAWGLGTGKDSNPIKVDLGSQVQLSSYSKSVIALCEVTNDDSKRSSWSTGTISFWRENGLSQTCTLRYSVQKEFNVAQAWSQFNLFGLGPGQCRPCTFLYEGKKYHGLEFYGGAAQYHFVEWVGFGNFTVFGLDYYDTESNVAINTEVDSSLNFDDFASNNSDDTYYNNLLEYNQGNILGTVSQSGGVPTGAIIERGSDSNGEYVKFADGTLICTQHRTLDGVGDTAYEATWTYPEFFAVTTPRTTHCIVGATSLVGIERRGIADTSNRTLESVRLRLLGEGNYTGAEAILTDAVAIGRWY